MDEIKNQTVTLFIDHILTRNWSSTVTKALWKLVKSKWDFSRSFDAEDLEGFHDVQTFLNLLG